MAREGSLGEERELEEEDVRGAARLRERRELSPEEDRVRGVEDREPLDESRVEGGDAPGDRAAPVVADEVRPFVPEVPDEVRDVSREELHPVAADALRLLREVVAAEVGGDDAEAGRGERGDLVPPREPVLREAVQEEDEGPLARLDPVEAQAADGLFPVGPRLRHAAMLTSAANHRPEGGHMKTTAVALLLGLASTGAFAQEARPPAPAAPVADPAMAGLRPIWGRAKDILVRAAEKMPEEDYSFKPSPDVRSFGQLAAHVADSNSFFGSVALGEKPPAGETEKTKTSKADILAALKESVAYVDRAFAMSDADAAKTVRFFGKDSPKFAVLALLIGHEFEHYGNMVTYMRMKGLVPPSSEPRPGAPAPPAEKK